MLPEPNFNKIKKKRKLRKSVDKPNFKKYYANFYL